MAILNITNKSFDIRLKCIYVLEESIFQDFYKRYQARVSVRKEKRLELLH